MNFSQRFSDLVARHPGTQAEIAEALGVSEGALSNYKRDRIPRADELHRIAQFFGVSMEFLLTGREDYPAAMVVQEDPAPYGEGAKKLTKMEKRIAEVIAELEAIKEEIRNQRN